MVLAEWEGDDFFIDFGEGLVLFTYYWEEAFLGLHWISLGVDYIIWKGRAYILKLKVKFEMD